METKRWWHVLNKDCRGSRPRCILLVDGSRETVATRLTELVGVPDVVVTSNDFWMPRGKPTVKTDNEWDKDPTVEARLDLIDGFVSSEIQNELRDWWLAVAHRANTPNWDVASTCEVEGKPGLLLFEAKAHANELSVKGKEKPNSPNGWKNHKRIGSAIAEANTELMRITGGHWGLSVNDHYQLANRFAWSWKLALLGIPIVLVYLGFLHADDMAKNGTLFRSGEDWTRTLKGNAQGVVDDSCWGRRLEINGTPLRALIRAIEQPFSPYDT